MSSLRDEWTTRATRRAYYISQRVRAGVRPPQIKATAYLLDSGRGEVVDHVNERLRATHGAGRDAFTWLRRQPLQDRKEVQDPAWDRSWMNRFRRLERKKTSGSSGKPVRICKDMQMAAQIDATMWALYGWHGMGPGMKHARFWGLARGGWERRKRRAMDLVLRRRRLGAFEVSPDTILRFFTQLRSFGPRYIHGYPSLISQFVDVCQALGKDGRDLGVEVIFLTGERILNDTQERIREFFDARIVSEYGCSESGLLAFGCEAGSSHLVPSTCLTELVGASDNGPWEGEGEVAITDLYGRHKPLLRYRLGDWLSMNGDQSCGCGRELPVVEIDAGRINGYLRMPDGSRVHDLVLAYSMPSDVRQFQARQVDEDRLQVLVECRNNKDGADVKSVAEANISKALDERIQVDVDVVAMIPKTEGGKHRFFYPLEECVNAQR